jgi:hypothetical protein
LACWSTFESLPCHFAYRHARPHHPDRQEASLLAKSKEAELEEARMAAAEAAAETRRFEERREAEAAEEQTGILVQEAEALMAERRAMLEAAEIAKQAAREHEEAMEQLSRDLDEVCVLIYTGLLHRSPAPHTPTLLQRQRFLYCRHVWPRPRLSRRLPVFNVIVCSRAVIARARRPRRRWRRSGGLRRRRSWQTRPASCKRRRRPRCGRRSRCARRRTPEWP